MIALLERLDTVETPDRVVADDLGLLRQLDAARLNG